ncbi:antitermination protein NusG, partial [Actinomyces sp. S6-Spd3]|uniref:transcription termination/antitermination NusG family protein n=2 Tax=Actinomycetales TaxID=2037 RepID=UPI0005104EB0
MDQESTEEKFEGEQAPEVASEAVEESVSQEVVEEAATDGEAPSAEATSAPSEETEVVDPIEAKREELSYLPGDWYVIHSYSGHERRVKANLEQRVVSQNA